MECGASSTSSIIVDEKALLGLCRQNKKITAIKLHRHVTGASIEESKAFIKNLMEYM
jgi:ribosomal protein L7/L12